MINVLYFLFIYLMYNNKQLYIIYYRYLYLNNHHILLSKFKLLPYVHIILVI